MSLILPNSIFHHAGRTGGHWVSHVLWRGDLIKERLFPLHLHPSQAEKEAAYVQKPFSFCFIRHPLSWLASVWRHEMEFGWNPASEITIKAESEHFDIFLENMLKAWPSGPCSSHLSPYYEASDFVGRTENLASDLGLALRTANEIFDPEILLEPAVNESFDPEIKRACKAPIEILQKVMAAETNFNKNFGYSIIPPVLVGGPERRSVWIEFKAKNEEAALRLKQYDKSSDIKFDYKLNDGARLSPMHIRYRGEQRMLIRCLDELLPQLERSKTEIRACVLDSHDPFFAYALSARGIKYVDFVANDIRVVPNLLIESIDENINILSIKDYYINDSNGYDFILMSSYFSEIKYFEQDLLLAIHKLSDAGILLMPMPIIRGNCLGGLKITNSDVSFHDYKRSISLYSWDYISSLLSGFGCEIYETGEWLIEAPPVELKSQVTKLSKVYGFDPEQSTGLSFCLIKKVEVNDSQIRLNGHVPLTLSHMSKESLPTAVQIMLEASHSIIAEGVVRADLLRQAAIDREAELKEARKQLHSSLIEVGHLESRIQRLNHNFQTLKSLEAAVVDREADLADARKELVSLRIDNDFSKNAYLRAQDDLNELRIKYEKILARLGFEIDTI